MITPRFSARQMKQLVIAAFVAGSVGPIASSGRQKHVAQTTTPVSSRLPVEGTFPSLGGATAWLNTKPLTPASLRGKVVLVSFWTYSCINWRRELPYLRAWAQRYGGDGLVVIGVHAPEFDFERELPSVERAAREIGVDYPVAVDNDYAVWNAFGNRYWPALYFIDAQGRVRGHRFGEGDYERSEEILRELLAEAGRAELGSPRASVEARGVEAAADWANLASPETYLGYARSQNFASPGGAVADERQRYGIPERLQPNGWALAGEWTVRAASAQSIGPRARIAYRFHARDLHLVMGSSEPGTAVRFRVLVDGQPPGAAHGADVDSDGVGTATEPRLYHLIRQAGSIRDRDFVIEFLDPGIRAFSFTFG